MKLFLVFAFVKLLHSEANGFHAVRSILVRQFACNTRTRRCRKQKRTLLIAYPLKTQSLSMQSMCRIRVCMKSNVRVNGALVHSQDGWCVNKLLNRNVDKVKSSYKVRGLRAWLKHTPVSTFQHFLGWCYERL